MKTTLAVTETASATNSAAHRETNLLPSGGLELTFNLFRDTTVFQWVKELQKKYRPCSVLQVLNKNVFAH